MLLPWNSTRPTSPEDSSRISWAMAVGLSTAYSPLTISFSSFSNLSSFGGSYGSGALVGSFPGSGFFGSLFKVGLRSPR